MKASPAIVEALADIERIEKGTDTSRVLSELLLGMARGEVSADKVEAAAKAIAAESARRHTELKKAQWAYELRLKAAELYGPVGDESHRIGHAK